MEQTDFRHVSINEDADPDEVVMDALSTAVIVGLEHGWSPDLINQNFNEVLKNIHLQYVLNRPSM